MVNWPSPLPSPNWEKTAWMVLMTNKKHCHAEDFVVVECVRVDYIRTVPALGYIIIT